MSGLTSFKPFLFRAYYDWFAENEFTPHILVDTRVRRVKVPPAYIRNHQIILSLAPAAVANFVIGKQGISFSARFGGVHEDVYVPFKAMKQLIAAENGWVLPIGQAFEAFDSSDDDYEDVFEEDSPSGSEEGFKFTGDDEEGSRGEHEDTRSRGQAPAFEILSDEDDRNKK